MKAKEVKSAKTKITHRKYQESVRSPDFKGDAVNLCCCSWQTVTLIKQDTSKFTRLQLQLHGRAGKNATPGLIWQEFSRLQHHRNVQNILLQTGVARRKNVPQFSKFLIQYFPILLMQPLENWGYTYNWWSLHLEFVFCFFYKFFQCKLRREQTHCRQVRHTNRFRLHCQTSKERHMRFHHSVIPSYNQCLCLTPAHVNVFIGLYWDGNT